MIAAIGMSLPAMLGSSYDQRVTADIESYAACCCLLKSCLLLLA
jgi:hypothetical protein